MTKYSISGVGMYAAIIVSVLRLAGVDVDEGQVTEAILAAATIISFAVWTWGQINRSDLDWGIFRK
jgi:hypothetical protein